MTRQRVIEPAEKPMSLKAMQLLAPKSRALERYINQHGVARGERDVTSQYVSLRHVSRPGSESAMASISPGRRALAINVFSSAGGQLGSCATAIWLAARVCPIALSGDFDTSVARQPAERVGGEQA